MPVRSDRVEIRNLIIDVYYRKCLLLLTSRWYLFALPVPAFSSSLQADVSHSLA